MNLEEYFDMLNKLNKKTQSDHKSGDGREKDIDHKKDDEFNDEEKEPGPDEPEPG